MDRKDRRALPFAIGGAVALATGTIVGTTVQFPNGAFDIGGMWAIAFSLVGGYIVGTLLSGWFLWTR